MFSVESTGRRDYIGIAKENSSYRAEEDELILHNSSIDDFHTIWMPYFDLARDYGRIKNFESGK